MQQGKIDGDPREDLSRTRNGVESRREVLHGEIDFVSVEAQTQRSIELLGRGALVVSLPPPTAAARGRLLELLDEIVERELTRRGAPSPYLTTWASMPDDAEARLADQLFRARTVGATGLVIAMGSLGAIAEPTLTPADSATLRYLAKTAAEAPLVILIDDTDLTLSAYPAPVPLETLLSAGRAPWRVPVPPKIVDRIETTVDRTTSVQATSEEKTGTTLASAPATEPTEPAAPTPTRRHERPTRAAIVASATVGTIESGPNDAWRSWAIALSSARGPQPLANFERLFAESYVPLAAAIAEGLDDPRALRSHDEFRRAFERSYSDAFAAFGATNRRPPLVMDAHDLAARQARSAHARAAHVLLVDSMRFDLGCLVRDELAREASGHAALVSEILLWSALPTTTMRQLETFARGLDALRAPSTEEPSESLRGRAAEVVRRLRVGSRELYKLDLASAMLEGASGSVIGALPGIARATAEAIARHVSTLAPRTLLFVVGDHGFSIGRRGEIQSGGASPEEVLVPGFSWLVGDVH